MIFIRNDGEWYVRVLVSLFELLMLCVMVCYLCLLVWGAVFYADNMTLLNRLMEMELRSRKTQNDKIAAREEGSQSKKRRISNRRENAVDVKHTERQRLRCLIEGGLWDNTSSSEYEPEYDEDEGSDGEVSLEVESNVEGESCGVVCGGQDWRCDIREGSCEVGERKKSSLRGGSSSRGGMGSSPEVVEDCGPCIEGGNGKSEVRRGKGRGHCWTSGEDNDVVLRSRCTLKKLVAVNGRMTATQRAAVEGTVLRPCLQYCDCLLYTSPSPRD